MGTALTGGKVSKAFRGFESRAWRLSGFDICLTRLRALAGGYPTNSQQYPLPAPGARLRRLGGAQTGPRLGDLGPRRFCRVRRTRLCAAGPTALENCAAPGAAGAPPAAGRPVPGLLRPRSTPRMGLPDSSRARRLFAEARVFRGRTPLRAGPRRIDALPYRRTSLDSFAALRSAAVSFQDARTGRKTARPAALRIRQPLPCTRKRFRQNRATRWRRVRARARSPPEPNRAPQIRGAGQFWF